MATPFFRRKDIRLPRGHYIGRRRYFITILCAGRQPLLVPPETARLVVSVLRETAHEQSFAIYSYCLMPDHLHLLAVGMSADCNLLNFVMTFKRRCTMASGKLWQKKLYDYILRDHDANGPVAAYIRMNPVRKGLCSSAAEYEFAGSFAGDWPGVANGIPWAPPWRR